jgi:hypothetical protein
MPLSMEDAIAWLQSHPPAGLYLNGNNGRTSRAVSWTYQDQPAPPYTRAELGVAVTSVGPQKSALRVDGQVLWMPPRSPAEHIPDDVQRVDLEERHGSQVVVRKTLHGSAARELASLLNGLGRTNMGPPRCAVESTKADNWTMTFPHAKGSFVFTAWTGCDSNPTILVDVNGQPQPPLWDVWQTAEGSYGPIGRFLDCLFSDRPDPGCRSAGSGSPVPTPDPLQGFCSNLHQFGDWFSAAQAQANGDETALAQTVQGDISGVMMWFDPNEQAISDPSIRAEADRIVADTVALQTWTPTMSESFTELLTTFSNDSAAFSSKHCP